MKIILSPAKKMKADRDTVLPNALPALIDEARQILDCLKSKTPQQLQELWNCSDDILQENLERLSRMDLRNNLTPAILSYEGIAYQYMAPSVFEDRELEYVQNHLRILSGFYGILRPLDGVFPYRLEMQAKLSLSGCSNLYEFWGDSLYRKLENDHVIINLASREYSKCIERYLTPEDTYITCTFAETAKGKLVQKATFAKMARGEMVRYMAEKQIEQPEQIMEFDRLNYHYRADLSTDTEFFFERCPEK